MALWKDEPAASLTEIPYKQAREKDIHETTLDNLLSANEFRRPLVRSDGIYVFEACVQQSKDNILQDIYRCLWDYLEGEFGNFLADTTVENERYLSYFINVHDLTTASR